MPWSCMLAFMSSNDERRGLRPVAPEVQGPVASDSSIVGSSDRKAASAAGERDFPSFPWWRRVEAQRKQWRAVRS